MSIPMRLTDDAIRLALTPAPDIQAPAGLADAIRVAVAATPQRRRSFLGFAPSRGTRIALRFALVGLLVFALVGLLLVVGSKPPPAPLPTTNTYHGGPERNGVMPGPGPTGAPSVEWRGDLQGPVGAWSPAVADGVVFVADQGGFVTASDELTGRQLWQKNVGAPINSGLTVASGVVIVGDDAGVIHGLDVTTGRERWRYQATAPVHSASAIVDGVAWIGSLAGALYALDVQTGTPRWPEPIQTAGPISRAIAASGGLVYVGSGGATAGDLATLQAYDASTGLLRWAMHLEPGNASTPSISDGRVFVTGGLDATSTVAHELYAFDASTGKAAWPAPFQAPTGKTLLIGAVADGLVFAESTDGTMYVVDAATGTPKWTAEIHSTQAPSAGVVGGTIYVTSDDRKIHAFDIASHQEWGGSWPFAIDGAPGSPTIVHGRIFIGTGYGQVISIAGAGSPSGAVSSP
jgi:outer membrane protein assembly factor BamB